MARFRNTLDHVRIAAPCKADWDQMLGNERVRFCGQCNLNVYNLSGMARADAESLIASTEGRLCVRFYRRSDGSIIAKDCPIGLRAIRRRMSYVAKAISSTVMGLLAGPGCLRSGLKRRSDSSTENDGGYGAGCGSACCSCCGPNGDPGRTRGWETDVQAD